MLDAAERCDPSSAARSATSDTRCGCGVIAARSTSDAFRFTARTTCYSTSDADAEQRRRCSVIEGVAAMLLGAFLPMRKPAGQLLREVGEDFLPIDDSLLEWNE